MALHKIEFLYVAYKAFGTEALLTSPVSILLLPLLCFLGLLTLNHFRRCKYACSPVHTTSRWLPNSARPWNQLLQRLLKVGFLPDILMWFVWGEISAQESLKAPKEF